MSLVTSLLGLPTTPVRGFLALARLIQEQTERELRDPAAVRHQLEEIDERAAAGELSPEEQRAAERQVLDRLRTEEVPSRTRT